MLFGQLVDEILRDVAPLKRPGTTELYFIYLGELKTELGQLDINQFGRKEYMEWMRGFKLRKDRKTFFDYTKFLNIAYRYAYQEKYIEHWIKFPSVDGERHARFRLFTQDEIETMAHVASGITKIQFTICYECFLRLREMLKLTWDRVDFPNRMIVLRPQDVKTGKSTKRGRNVPMTETVYNMLLKLRETATSEYVFPSPTGRGPQHENRKSWKWLKLDAGIVGPGRWQDLRHTAISHGVMILKLPLAHISKVAGVSIKTLERVYLHHMIDDVRDVAEKMSAIKKTS